MHICTYSKRFPLFKYFYFYSKLHNIILRVRCQTRMSKKVDLTWSSHHFENTSNEYVAALLFIQSFCKISNQFKKYRRLIKLLFPFLFFLFFLSFSIFLRSSVISLPQEEPSDRTFFPHTLTPKAPSRSFQLIFPLVK